MVKITKLTPFVLLLGTLVFGQAWAAPVRASSAQADPQPIVIATAEAPSVVVEPAPVVPETGPTVQPTAGQRTFVPSPTSISSARLEPAGNGFLISWTTAQPSTGWVIYGSAPDALASQIPTDESANTLATEHSVLLPMPDAEMPLYFAIVADNIRQDAESWPMKVFAGSQSETLTLSAALGTWEATQLVSGLPIEGAAPDFMGVVVGSQPGEGTPDSANPQPAAVASCPPSSCTPGKNVGRDFFVQVVQRLSGVPYNEFAVNALEAWKPYEGTNACWNPLATTMKMEEVCNFNTVGVQNYQTQDMGVRATASTLNLHYYTAIRRMLARETFDREGIRGALGTWGTCSGASCESLLNNWQALYNNYSGDTDDNRTLSNGETKTGTINPNNDEDTYFFDASANTQATIRMTRTSGATLDSFLELYAPNGSLVAVDDDSAGSLNSLINNKSLAVGGRYKIVARSWSRGSSGPYSISLTLGSGTVSCATGQYKAEYWNNRSFSGSPTFTRCESSINNDWGGGGPGNGVGNDNFSARWTGRHNFAGGNTRFIATADDGIKVYLDGSTIIDGWRDQAPTEYRTERSVSAGTREVKVEYYENGGGAVARLRWEQVSTPTCSPSADQVALFIDGNYQGQCVVRGIGNYTNPSAIGMPNDSISSVKVGSNVRLSVYEHDGYQGRSSAFTGNDSNLSDNTIGNDSVSSMKVERRSSSGSSNLALNRPASATSQESSTYSPSRGNDGNNSSRWSSQLSPTLGGQRWYIDLGSARSVSRVRINWEAAYAAQYRIVYSDNGSNWFYYTADPLYTRSGPGWAEHTFSTRTHRFVAVSMYVRAPRMNNFSFFEFEAYDSTRSGVHDSTDDIPVETLPEVVPQQIEQDVLLPSVQQ